jgi:hypothetical protein
MSAIEGASKGAIPVEGERAVESGSQYPKKF